MLKLILFFWSSVIYKWDEQVSIIDLYYDGGWPIKMETVYTFSILFEFESYF